MNFELPPGFTDSVLSQTSGKVCESAEERLPDFVDGDLDEVKQDIVSLHLEDCSECRNLEGALRLLEVDLQALAEVTPEPNFLGEVMAATSQAPRKFQAIADVWRTIVARPRFAYEFAYAGTMALVFVMWIGGSGSLSDVAAQLANSAPAQTFAASGELAKETSQETSRIAGIVKSLLVDRVRDGVRDGVESGKTLVGENTETLSNRAVDISEWSQDKWTVVAEGLVQTDGSASGTDN